MLKVELVPPNNSLERTGDSAAEARVVRDSGSLSKM